MKAVILGGGYAGVWTYRALTRWLGRKVEVTLISDYDYHNFHGWTGDVISGDLSVEVLRTPLHECFPKAEHVIGKATRVNEASSSVTVEIDGGEREVQYDHLIVATGARERTDHIEGVFDHGWRLRDPNTLGRLVQHVDQNVAGAPTEAGRTAVVLGSGFTGTEVAAALGRRLKGRGRVVLVSTGEHLIPSFANRKLLQRHLHHHLNAANVELVLGRAAKVDADGVHLLDSTFIPAATVINATGNVPVVPEGLEAYIDDFGHLKVDEHLRLSENIWAAGDVAVTRDWRGRVLVKDALWATASGTKVGRNIARVARKASPLPLYFPGLGQVATFDRYASSGLLYGMPLSGPHAYLLRMVVFLWFVPSRRNMLRVARSFAFARYR